MCRLCSEDSETHCDGLWWHLPPWLPRGAWGLGSPGSPRTTPTRSEDSTRLRQGACVLLSSATPSVWLRHLVASAGTATEGHARRTGSSETRWIGGAFVAFDCESSSRTLATAAHGGESREMKVAAR